MKPWNPLALILLLTLAAACCPATLATRPKLPPIKSRPVEVRCCLVKDGDGWKQIDEKDALRLYSPSMRFYFLDGTSWGNLLKNAAETSGRVKEYEQYH